MAVQIFKGVRLYFQAVLAIVRYPALLPEVIAMAALKYRREVPSARYHINPSTDRVEIFCTVTNVTSWTVDAGVPVGKIGWATAVPGATAGYMPSWAPAETAGQIAPHRDGELFAAMSVPAVQVRGLHLKVWLNLGPGNGQAQEFRDELFLNF